MALTRIDFPVLARGMNREAPIGTLNPNAAEGPLWREMNNLVPHEGALRRREAVVEATGGLPTFLDDTEQSVIGLFEVSPYYGGTARWLLVTSREIYLGDFGAWTNLTPRYETGTVTINNGSTTLTGLGTEWQVRRIAGTSGVPEQSHAVELPLDSGDWYAIDTVTNDTSITLATPYTGSNLAGDDYSIRRSFIGGTNFPVYAASLNGDLYIAGFVSSGVPFGVSVRADGGVLKILGGATLAKTSFDAASDVSFLTSGTDPVESGLDNLGYAIEVAGLAVLSDGRLILPTFWFDTSTDESGSRVHYSSLTNLAVWTASPGGFTDVTDFSGTVTAMTGGGASISLHFADGIAVGDLTGAQDPPLRFRASRAKVGAAGPKVVVSIPGGKAIPPGDLFIGADASIYLFNGGDALPVTWASARADLIAGSKGGLYRGFSHLDTFRGYASFFVRQSGFGGAEDGGSHREIRLYYDTGDYCPCDYRFRLTAAATPLFDGGSHERSDVAGYLGTHRFDDGDPTAFVYEMRDDETVDELPAVETSDGISALTDKFTNPSRRWAVSHVEAFATGVGAGTDTLKLEVLRDGAAESLTASVALTVANEAVATFFPSAQSARQVQLRIGSNDGSDFNFRLTRLTAWLADTGEARTG